MPTCLSHILTYKEQERVYLAVLLYFCGMQQTAKFHLLVILTILVWGLTFASTKVLILHGLSPTSIMLLRFVLAYLGMWVLTRGRLFSRSWRDEGWMLLAGMTGGSLYFLTENVALSITTTTNVAIVISGTPLLTALLTHRFVKSEPFRLKFLLGGLLAVVGIALVVLNGQFVLSLNPLGDVLTLCASLCWACYNIVIKKLSHYSVAFVTRKVFFYGILTILPVYLFRPFHLPATLWSDPYLWGNLLFLGVVASLLCFLSWNLCVERLGIMVCANYLYLTPIVALTVAWSVLGEQLTMFSIGGAALILTGVYIAERKSSTIPTTKDNPLKTNPNPV